MKTDNIEEIYGELGAFSKEPPKELWDKIEARLHPKKKRRRVIFFWGAAAAILVLFIGYTIVNSLGPNLEPNKVISDIENHKTDNNSNNKSETETIKIVEEASDNNITDDSLLEKQNIKDKLLNNQGYKNQLSDRTHKNNSEEETANSVKSINEKIANDKKEKLKYNESYTLNSKEEKKEELINKDLAILKKETINNTKNEKEKVLANNDSISKFKKNTLLNLSEELLAENKERNDSINTNEVKRLKWSVEVLGGLSNTASESSIQGESVNTTSQNDFLYTLKLGYAITDRLMVKSGIGKNVLGQEINNISYVTSDVTLSVDNSQNIVSNQSVIFLTSQESINDFSTVGNAPIEGDFQQQFEYIQVPLEFSYNVLRAQKVDIALGFGGNLNFLTNNRTFLDNEQIGESIGVNTTIFGATINSNLSFQLAKKTILFVEPSYNYFEKPIDNNNQAFKNTQFRALFGLRYIF